MFGKKGSFIFSMTLVASLFALGLVPDGQALAESDTFTTIDFPDAVFTTGLNP